MYKNEQNNIWSLFRCSERSEQPERSERSEPPGTLFRHSLGWYTRRPREPCTRSSAWGRAWGNVYPLFFEHLTYFAVNSWKIQWKPMKIHENSWKYMKIYEKYMKIQYPHVLIHNTKCMQIQENTWTYNKKYNIILVYSILS